MSLDESARCQFENQRAVETRVEAPVKGIERFGVPKSGLFDAPADKPIAPPFEFVVHQ